MRRQPREQAPPIVGVVVGIAMLLFGLFLARNQIHIHMAGHRVMARIQSISRSTGRNSSASTHLTFTTLPGAGAQCTVEGVLGDVGRPVWIRYLPSDPTHCAEDALGRSLRRAIYLTGFGLVILIASFVLYRRAQRGEDVRQP